MKFSSLALILSSAVVCSCAMAQEVTTNGGQPGFVPLFSGGTTIGNSNISQSSVGVVEVGLAGSPQNFQVFGGTTTGTDSLSIAGAKNYGIMYLGDTNSYIRAVFNGGLRLGTYGSQDALMIQQQTSNIGVGTVSPNFRLEVNGNVGLTAGSSSTITFADGSVQKTAWNGTTLGGDYAESVDVQGQRQQYEPGDVIVIDPAAPGKFMKSQAPYSSLVAGIFSTKPGLVGRRLTAERPDKKDEVPMAMIGIVPTKVTDENGPIIAGDLLVTASRPGYAMKGSDTKRLNGAVIGKALGPLEKGVGVVEVLISIQ